VPDTYVETKAGFVYQLESAIQDTQIKILGTMKRRHFVKTSILGSLAIGLGNFPLKEKKHILTLSFDDGFKDSFFRTADIYEAHGLKACLNVIASGHLPSFQSPDKYITAKRGDFNDWNALKKRGHEIMPHTWDHTNLTQIPFDKAREDIDKCLSYFEQNLDGFKTSDAVYNFAFNASTPELEQYALTKVRAVRTQGDSALNPVPSSSRPVRLGCWSYGPDNADTWVEKQVNEFLAAPGGWLILNLHGLDTEGWGPVTSKYLNALLKRLVKLEYLDILPAGEVLKRSSK
jgi:peptidoglycan/xylan/chitin deacetylase (PgdA/CDA1 family)